MDVSQEMIQVGGYEQDDDDEEEEEEDLCRICRSPEEPGNSLRYPCACRGSMKYVHEDCINLWLNRRGYKQCEVCGRDYSFVTVYSENAPKRLSCHEFLKGVLLRASPYLRIIVPWVVAFLLNTYCCSLLLLRQELDFEQQIVSRMLWKSDCLLCGLMYNVMILSLMDLFILMRIPIEELLVESFIENALGHGVVSRVAHLLWIYCNWCHSQLRNFLGEPPRLVGVALHEFGALGRLLFLLDENAFTALNISIYVSFLFVLLPFSIGWIALATVGSNYFSDKSPVILGYMVMLSVSLACLVNYFTLRQPNLFSAIVRWFSLGYHFTTAKLPCLMWVFSIAVCKNMFAVVKRTFVLGLKVGVFPWIIGCWLDVCTFSMSGTTLSRRIEILSNYPPLMVIYWTNGLICVMIAFNFMNLIQEIIQNRAFCFLLDINDPDYRITNLNLGQTLFAFASHEILLVILLHLPIKAITLISPSFFPLEFWAYNIRIMPVAIPAYMMMVNVSSGWFDRVIRQDITPIVHTWITTVSSWLWLSEFLLQNVRQVRRFDDDPWLYVNAIAEGSVVNLYGTQNDENDIDDQRDNMLMLRLVMFWILAALALFLVSTTFMALPILLGRTFFYSVSFIIRFRLKHDDLYAFWIGSYILRAIYIKTCFVFDHIRTGRTHLLLKYGLIWTRNGLFFSIWISVIPGLLGLLIDLMVIIPYRVQLNESPIYFLIQDWLIGLVVLHIWTFLTMFSPINCFATKAWRKKLQRIEDEGIDGLHSMWLLGSIVNTLLTTLCIPYLLLKTLFPLLGVSQSENATIERFIWPVLLALIAVWFIAKQTYDLTVYLHQLVFDDRYVVGKRVRDLTENL